MIRIPIRDETSLTEFRDHVRGLIAANTPPDQVSWATDTLDDLFGEALSPVTKAPAFSVPAAFVDLADTVLCHREPQRFAQLYTLLWRLTHGERMLLSMFSDPLVYRLRHMEKAVRRDRHKMTAFVRFRKVEDADGERFIAWFEPQHRVLRKVADFFADRFTNMRWSILTPDGTLTWDGREIAYGPGVPKHLAPQDDALEDWWKRYYRATFNPARANPRHMQSEMAKRYWKNLPEAALIPEMLAQARTRTEAMIASPPTAPRRAAAPHAIDTTTDVTTLAGLRAAAASCERCPLHGPATQTVFGEGPEHTEVAFVGEQPGDHEDLAGKPFVGPAGQLFDRAAAEAGIDRARVYVTNAVKHFKFEARGKRRIHQKPDAGEVSHCRWWLEQELALVRPKLVVALGATAARALTGHAVKITAARGGLIPLADGTPMLVTVHPSYLLRLPDRAAQDMAYRQFVADLKAAAAHQPAIRRAA